MAEIRWTEEGGIRFNDIHKYIAKVNHEVKILVSIKNLHPEFITNEKGQKKSVILPILDFQELIDDI